MGRRRSYFLPPERPRFTPETWRSESPGSHGPNPHWSRSVAWLCLRFDCSCPDLQSFCPPWPVTVSSGLRAACSWCSLCFCEAPTGIQSSEGSLPVSFPSDASAMLWLALTLPTNLKRLSSFKPHALVVADTAQVCGGQAAGPLSLDLSPRPRFYPFNRAPILRRWCRSSHRLCPGIRCPPNESGAH